MIGNTLGADGDSFTSQPPPSPNPPPVPIETVLVDPETGIVPNVIGPVPDITDGYVPSDILYQIGVLEHDIRQGLDAADEGIGGWLSGVTTQLDAAERDIGNVVTGVAGGILSSTDGSAAEVTRCLDRIVTGVGKSLSSASSDIRQAGVDLPYDPGVWAMMMEESPTEWLPHIVPEIGAAVGMTAGQPPDPQFCELTREGLVCPPSPPEPPPADILCWDGTWVSNFNDCPPKPPDNGGGDTLPGGGGGDDGGGGGGSGGGSGGSCPAVCPAPVVQCPAPPAINVTVPTPQVTVNVPPSPPSPTKPPTCPDPTPVDVSVDLVMPPGQEPPQVPGPPGPDDTIPPLPTGHINWALPQPCDDLDAYLASIPPPQPSTSSDPTGVLSTIWQGVKNISNPLYAFLEKPIKLVTEGLTSVVASQLAAPTVMYNAGVSLVNQMAGSILGAQNPNPGAAFAYGSELAAAGFAEANTHFPMRYLHTSTLYAFQAANPQWLPSQAQIDAMWVKGRIYDEQWECWTRAQGNIPQHARVYRDTLVGMPTYDELKQLRLRGVIDETKWAQDLKYTGWSNSYWSELLWNLSEQLPSQADILRMMVRDAEDQTVVDKYEYDKDFDVKFSGQLKKWFESQGISANVARYFWRSHWVIPSNTQLYEMYHRLRPDREIVRKWEAEAAANGDAAATALLGPKPPVVTLKDVQDALEVNDQAPYWVPKQIEIAYHPITRTDAVRAYQIGAFTVKQLREAMLDNGYSPSDADLLTDFYRQDAAIKNANQAGVLTIRKIITFYKEGAMTRFDANSWLSDLIQDVDRRTRLLQAADAEMRAELNSTKLKLLRKKFIHGEDMPGGWVNAISAITQDNVAAARLLERWNAEYALRSREVTALTLCKWLKHNVISLDDYVTRLVNLGYTFGDAMKIAKVCDDEKQLALAKEIERRQKEAARLSEKAQRLKDKQQERECHPPKPCWDGSPAPVPKA